NLHYLVAGCSLGDFDFNSGMVVAVFRDQFVQEAAGDQGVDADAQTSTLSRHSHAGGRHSMFKLIDARSYALDKAATGLGQPNATSLSLKQLDSEIFLQRFHAGADAGLCHAKCFCCMAKV